MCNLEDRVLVEAGIEDRFHIQAAIENYMVEVANDDRNAEEAAIKNGTHLVEVAIENCIPVETNPVAPTWLPSVP